jgi:hypothetical protein
VSRQLRKLPIGYEQLRSLVIEYLGMAREDPTLQINNLRYGVAAVAIKKRLDPDRANSGHGTSHVPAEDAVLSDPDFILVGEIMWDLIIEGVLRPGDSLGSQVFPHFHITERGIELVEQGLASPYDPDGYLSYHKARL